LQGFRDLLNFENLANLQMLGQATKLH